MNFFQRAINSEQVSAVVPKSYIEAYMQSMRPEELRRFFATYLPHKLNEELKTTPENDYTTRPPFVNLLNICSFPVAIMSVVLFIQNIHILWKICIVLLLLAHIVISTTFVMTIEQRKKQTTPTTTTTSLVSE